MLNQEGYSHEEAGNWILQEFPDALESDLMSAVTLYNNNNYKHTRHPQMRGVDITDTQAKEMFL